MSKRGNYFIAMYDSQDNNIMEFESIKECADYFNTNIKTISRYIHELRKLKNEFLLFKIFNDQAENISKSLQEKTR